MSEVVPGNGSVGDGSGVVDPTADPAVASRHGASGIRVALSPDQRVAVAAEAKRRGVPMTVLVRGMVEHFMPSLGFQPPPANGAPPASAPPSADPSAATPAAAAPAATAPYGSVPGSVGQPAVPTVVPPVSPDAAPGVETHFAPEGAYRVNGDAVPGVPGGPLMIDSRAGAPGVLPGAGVDRSLVMGGGVSESGVVVMLPGVGPDGRPRAARVPVASYVSETRPPSGLFSLLATAPAFVRYGLLAFAVLTVCLTFVYLGSTVVTSRASVARQSWLLSLTSLPQSGARVTITRISSSDASPIGESAFTGEF